MASDFRLRIMTLRSPAAQYAFALLVLVVATVIRALLNPMLGDRLPYIFYFVAVAVVSLTCDLYAALVELVGSALLANVLFIVPQYHFSFSNQALLSGALYLISGCTIVYAGQAYRRSTRALQEQQDWLHTTITSIGDAVIATDADGLITLMNPMAEKLTGWLLNEARGKPLAKVFRILNQETRQTVENPMEKVRRLNKVVGLANHTMLISKSGEEIAIDDSGAPIFAHDGTLTGIILVFRDVTKQRKAQKATAELAAIIQHSGDAIATKNLDGIIQTWNEAAERLFGYKREEIVGKPVTIIIPPDRLHEETEILQRIRKGEPSERMETIRIRKDGRPVHVSVCVSPIKDADGHVIGASKVVHDITALAAAREELLREKEFLATTIASIGDAVIATDAQGRVMLMNRVAETLTGWALDEARGKPLTEVFRVLNQESRQTVENPVDKVRRLNKVVGLANHTILISKSGEEIAIDDSGAPIFAPDGALAGIVLVFRDVTKARKAEARLTAQAALLDLAWDAIIVRDELGHIKFWNRGAEELYGWSREEAVGKTTHELIRTRFPVPLPEIIRQTREENRWQGELVHTTKSGRQITVLSRWGFLPTKDASGVPDLMETNTDITRRKQDEEQIRQQREWFRTTLTSIGDAVIATDAQGRISLMNSVAEKLTGWQLREAQGKPLVEVFRIVNQETHQTVENPVDKVRRLNRVVGLANHTILISKGGEEIAIDDSGAPIFTPDGALTGIVLVFRDVTEQRKAQKATAELAAIVEYSGDAIATKNLDGIIQTWNAGAERLFGYKAAEVIGRPVTILNPPDRLHEEAEILQRIRKGLPAERLETVRVRKDGRPVHVSESVSPIKDADGHVIGASKVVHDITELTAARQALVLEKELLAAQREWLHTTLTSIGDAVIATDPDGLITLMNPVAEQLTEWKSEEAVGKPLMDVFRIVNQETRKPVENPVEKVRRLNHVVGLANHTVLISKSGQEIGIDDSGAPIRDSTGRIIGIVLIFRDVTQQRILEAALKSNERLALAGRLSASIAHEIHNPLDTVGNVLFLLEQEINGQPKARQLIETAQREVQRVVEISKNMLSLHRESRTPSKVKLSELLEGVVALVKETIAKDRRKIELLLAFEGEVEAFPSELRQVFTNVIKNAVEATADGGHIKICSESVEQSGQNGVLVRVVDDGVGIPEQLRERLFNPFVTTKEESGTGLGLWVSRSIVEKHRGSIRLEGSTSKSGSGTTVAIFLPLRNISREDDCAEPAPDITGLPGTPS